MRGAVLGCGRERVQRGVLLLQGVAAWQVRAEGAWREVTAADWGGRNALDEAPIGVGVVPRAVW